MKDQITALSASKLSSAIRKREISCKEVMAAYLERIHRYNPPYNAIVSLANDDRLFRQAEAADKAEVVDQVTAEPYFRPLYPATNHLSSALPTPINQQF